MNVVEDMAESAKRKNLGFLVKHNGFSFTETFFPYTSGEIGPYYIQSGVIQGNGEDFREAVNSMVDLIGATTSQGSNFDVISGGESRDWIFSLPVAYMMGKPHAMIYKDRRIVGNSMNGGKVTHVADLNNEGSSPRDLWIPAINDAGGTIEDIFFYVDRMERGVKVMEELGLRSHSVVPLDGGAWQYLLENDVISPEIYNNLMRRIDDQDKWAKQMLRSDDGYNALKELIKGKQKEKGRKILTKGYPELREELVERLEGDGISVF